MTPKEKAKELIEKFARIDGYQDSIDLSTCLDEIEYALITVDEILQAIDWHKFETPNVEIDFWQEVNNELLKMKL
jgi:hypothetical protein